MSAHRDDLEAALRFLDERGEERDREGRRALGDFLLGRIATEHEEKQRRHQTYLNSLRRGHGLDAEEEEDGESKNDY